MDPVPRDWGGVVVFFVGLLCPRTWLGSMEIVTVPHPSYLTFPGRTHSPLSGSTTLVATPSGWDRLVHTGLTRVHRRHPGTTRSARVGPRAPMLLVDGTRVHGTAQDAHGQGPGRDTVDQ